MNEPVKTYIFGLNASELKLLIIMAVIVLILVIGIFVAKHWLEMDVKLRNAKVNRFYMIFYRMFSGFPLTRGYVDECYKRLKRLHVSTEEALKKETTVTAVKGIIVFIVVTIASLFLFSNIICKILGVVLAYLMMNRMLVRTTTNTNLAILNKLSGFIGILREEFLRTGSIQAALQTDDCPNILKMSVEEIREIMAGNNQEEKLAKFLEKTSCDYVKTLAIACIKIDDMGEELEEGKEPTFIHVLKYLEEDVNAEIERRTYLKNKFGLLEYTSLIPMVATDLLPSVLGGSMPGLNVVYDGISGYIFKVLLVLTSVMGYYIITTLSQIDGVEEDDRNAWCERKVKEKYFDNISEVFSPKGKSRRKLKTLMQQSLTKKSIRGITLERLLIAVAVFIGCIIIGFTASKAQKRYAINSTNTFGMIASSDTEAWDDDFIREHDNEIMAKILEQANYDTSKKANSTGDEAWVDDEWLHAELGGIYNTLTELQLEDQMSRIKKKYDLINSAYFHWYFVLIAFGAALLFYHVPIWMLKFRKWNIEKQEQEEFLALQTLCTIIAISDSDVLDAIESMYKMAKLYKERILYCYLSYCANPHKELERLESKVELTDFKRLIKKFKLAIEDVSLKEAFEGMDIERKHIVTMREQQMAIAINDRRNKAGLASKVSMAILVAGMLIFPIIYVGFSELMKVFGSLQAM